MLSVQRDFRNELLHNVKGLDLFLILWDYVRTPHKRNFWQGFTQPHHICWQNFTTMWPDWTGSRPLGRILAFVVRHFGWVVRKWCKLQNKMKKWRNFFSKTAQIFGCAREINWFSENRPKPGGLDENNSGNTEEGKNLKIEKNKK